MPSAFEAATTRQRTLAFQGSDTANLLDHIAYSDVVKPAFGRLKDDYGRLLVKAVLGTPPTIRDYNGEVHTITKEQLGARIEALEWLEGLLEGIVRRGREAEGWLHQHQRQITSNEL